MFVLMGFRKYTIKTDSHCDVLRVLVSVAYELIVIVPVNAIAVSIFLFYFKKL